MRAENDSNLAEELPNNQHTITIADGNPHYSNTKAC